MRVEDILRIKGNRVVKVSPSETIAVITKLMIDRGIGAVIVVDDTGALLGVLSERDIVLGLSRYADDVLNLTAEMLMRSDVSTCHPSDTLLHAMALMTDRRVRHLPVLGDAGDLCGIVSVGDAVKGRIDEIESEAKALREYIAMA
jgi:CBS domain-containing protein